MKNIDDVLRQKEYQVQQLQLKLEQLQKDIEILKAAMRLLADDNVQTISSKSRGSAGMSYQ